MAGAGKKAGGAPSGLATPPGRAMAAIANLCANVDVPCPQWPAHIERGLHTRHSHTARARKRLAEKDLDSKHQQRGYQVGTTAKSRGSTSEGTSGEMGCRRKQWLPQEKKWAQGQAGPRQQEVEAVVEVRQRRTARGLRQQEKCQIASGGGG